MPVVDEPERSWRESDLAGRLHGVRGDDAALAACLRELPVVERLAARVVAVRELGAARGAAICNRAFQGVEPGHGVLDELDRDLKPGSSAGAGERAARDRRAASALANHLIRLARTNPEEVQALLGAAERPIALAALAIVDAGRASSLAALDRTTSGLVARVVDGRALPVGDLLLALGQSCFAAARSAFVSRPRGAAVATRLGDLAQRTSGALAAARAFAGQLASRQHSPDEAERDPVARESALERVVRAAGDPLPEVVAHRMAKRLGHDVSHVRVHTGAEAARAARALAARAFTIGHHIFFESGAWDPATPSGERLLVHELTHVVQHDQGRLPTARGDGLRVSRPDDAHEREAAAAEQGPAAPRREPDPRPAAEPRRADPIRGPGEEARDQRSQRPTRSTAPPRLVGGVASRLGLGDITGGLSDAWDATGGRVVTGVADGGRWVANQAADGAEWALRQIVDRVAPGLIDLLTKGPGELLKPLIDRGMAAFTRALGVGTGFDAFKRLAADLVGGFASLLTVAKDTGLACCETVGKMLESLGGAITSILQSKAVTAVRKAFEKASEIVTTVLGFIGATAIDALTLYLKVNYLEPAQGLWGMIQAVARASAKALDWLLRQFGVPNGLDGIINWFKRAAEQLWETIKANWRPVVAILGTLAAVLLQLSPLGPLLDLILLGVGLAVGLRALWENKDNIRAWIAKQPAIRSTIAALKKVGEVFKAIGAFFSDLLQRLSNVLDQVTAALASLPLISLLVGLFNTLKAPIQELLAQVRAGVKAALDAAAKVANFLWQNVLEPLLQVLSSVALAVAMPAMIPLIFAGWAWRLIPDCLAKYIINFLLDVLIAFLRATPSIVLFGVLWPIVRAGAIGFLERARAFSDDEKVAIANKVAKIISGSSPQLMAGFVVGFFKGMFDGVVDPFKMIFEILKAVAKVFDWIAKIALHYPQYKPIIDRYLTLLRPLAAAAMAKAQAVVTRMMTGGGMSGAELVQMLGDLWGKLVQKAGEAGAAIAEKIGQFLLGQSSEYDIGYGIGWLLGNIAVMIILSVLSDGAWAAGVPVLEAIQMVAKVLNLPYELMGQALGALGKAFEPLLAPIRALFSALKIAEWPIVRELIVIVEQLFKTLTKFAEELALKLVEKLGTGVLERLTAEVGANLARRLVLDLGEPAAARLLDQLGADALKALGQFGGRQLETWLARFGADVLKEVGTLGEARLAEIMARLGQAGFERVLGLAGKAGVERLASLDAAAVQRLLALDDAALRRLLTLEEASWRRIAALDAAALQRIAVLDATGLARLMRLDEHMYRRMLALDEGAFQRVMALPESELLTRPIGQLSVEEFMSSRAVQERLFANAQAASARQQALVDQMISDLRITGADARSILKRPTLDEFIEGVVAKCERNGYRNIGQMDDIIRGRINLADMAEVDRVAAELQRRGVVQEVTRPRMSADGTLMKYPRYHVIMKDAETGLTHEWQIGTETTTRLYETEGIAIPDSLRTALREAGKAPRADLHDIEYDLFQAVNKQFPGIAQETGIPEFIRAMQQASNDSAVLGRTYPLEERLRVLHGEASRILQRLVDRQGPEWVTRFFH